MTRSVHSCEKEIQEANLKITPARLATLRFFEQYDIPVDAKSLIDYLQKQLAIDRATGFRILNTFVENDLLRKIEFGEGKSRYERANKKDHHHLICESCGTITDVADTVLPDLEKKLVKKTGFLITRHSLEFFGLCRQCQN